MLTSFREYPLVSLAGKKPFIRKKVRRALFFVVHAPSVRLLEFGPAIFHKRIQYRRFNIVPCSLVCVIPYRYGQYANHRDKHCYNHYP